jgi:predicted homoserine dehydrogenase-like protein
MYDIILKSLEKRRENPIDVIVVGLGFVSIGFISSIRHTPGIRVPLVITRRLHEASKTLISKGFKVKIESSPTRIKDWADKGYVCVSDDLGLVQTYENEVVIEMTGTVDYGCEVGLKTIAAGKHFVTMNPELQVTVGAELKALADKKHVITTDVFGDQPGNIARLIYQARLMGFNVLVAGNMKRYLKRHATQAEMTPWSRDKGLSVNQTVNFTDGTKQSIELNLVANYFDMDILEFGMRGPQIDNVHDALNHYDFDHVPGNGVVDYVVGKNLSSGVFLIVEHTDPLQIKYLWHLGLGDGPRFVLFEPYHLCHLEVAVSIAKVVLFNQEIINNRVQKTKTIAVAKKTLRPGDVLGGIGSDDIYGNISHYTQAGDFLPIGVACSSVIINTIHQDQPVKLSDVHIPDTAATRLLGLKISSP